MKSYTVFHSNAKEQNASQVELYFSDNLLIHIPDKLKDHLFVAQFFYRIKKRRRIIPRHMFVYAGKIRLIIIVALIANLGKAAQLVAI